MSATEFRELAIKARNEKRAKLSSKFEELLAAARVAAAAGDYVKEFPGQFDPLIVQMFEERQFRVTCGSNLPDHCLACSLAERPSDSNRPPACEAHRDSIVTRVLWGTTVGGDKLADDSL
jgi:hypothetical protein